MSWNSMKHPCRSTDREFSHHGVHVIDLSLPGKPDPILRNSQMHKTYNNNYIQSWSSHANKSEAESISFNSNGQSILKHDTLNNQSINKNSVGSSKNGSTMNIIIDGKLLTADTQKSPQQSVVINHNLKCSLMQITRSSLEKQNIGRTTSWASDNVENLKEISVSCTDQELITSKYLSSITKCETPLLNDEVLESYNEPNPTGRSESNMLSDIIFPIQVKDYKEICSNRSDTAHRRAPEISKQAIDKGFRVPCSSSSCRKKTALISGSTVSRTSQEFQQGRSNSGSLSTRASSEAERGRSNSCHKYLSTTDLMYSVFHQADLSLGQPTKASLLRNLSRESSAPPTRTTNHTHETFHDDIEENRTRTHCFSRSKSVNRMLSHLIPEGQTLHSFLTGAKYNRYCSHDSDEYLIMIGRQISKANEKAQPKQNNHIINSMTIVSDKRDDCLVDAKLH